MCTELLLATFGHLSTFPVSRPKVASSVDRVPYLHVMTLDNATLFNAYSSRDARFDGVFFVGVTSTSIYCRPICPAKRPKMANCRFFESAAEAEQASFRPCLRCRPELAPGNAPVDTSRRIVQLLYRRVDEEGFGDGASIQHIADRFGWSSRQLRRMVRSELGISLMSFLLTRRLLLAKRLLTETAAPITAVAFASGFASIRRFNDAFRRRYGMAPRSLRRAHPRLPHSSDPVEDVDAFTLQLAYRAPYDWAATLRFLTQRALPGVEHIDTDSYCRTVQVGARVGWFRVVDVPATRSMSVRISYSLMPVLPALLGRLQQLFDLGARPDVIGAQLAHDARLARSLIAHPGLRVPGAFDGFELAWRAIVSQRVSVRAASTIAGRVVAAFGAPLDTAYSGLTRLSPGADALAAAQIRELTALGIPASRGRCMVTLAEEVRSGRLSLEPGACPQATIASLIAIPGVGPWTAQYIAMRALHWPDAFPKEDLVLRRLLGGVSPAVADVLSQQWRPWRSYAAMHLWQVAGENGPHDERSGMKARM
jgi:AraC family transcriptional regulator of adaptative response / DNA-3-methyladenine glycosylase II